MKYRGGFGQLDKVNIKCKTTQKNGGTKIIRKNRKNIKVTELV